MNIPQPLADSVGRPTPLDMPLLAAGSPARSESGSEPFESLLRPPTPSAPLPQAASPKPAPPPEPAASQPAAEPASDAADDTPNHDDCSACPTPEAEAAAAAAEGSTTEEDDVESSEEDASDATVAAEAATAIAVLAALPTQPPLEKPEPKIEKLSGSRSHAKAKHAEAKPEPAVALQATVEPVALAKTQPVTEAVETEVEAITEGQQPVEPEPVAAAAIDSPQPVAPPVPDAVVSVPVAVEPLTNPEPQPEGAPEALAAISSNDSGPAPTVSLSAERPATIHEAEAFSIEPVETVRAVNEEQSGEESESNANREESAAALGEPPPTDAPPPANSPNGSTGTSSTTPVAPPAARLSAELLGGAQGVRASETTAVQVDSARLLHRVARAFAAAQNGDGEVRLRLSPPELGAIRLEIRVQDGAVIARMQTETSAARTAILDNLPALRERLSEQGVRIDRFDVELMQRQSGGPADQSGNRQPHDSLPMPRPAAAEVRRPQPAEGVVARRPLVADADSRRLNVIV